MAEGEHHDTAYGRSGDPALDAAEHLAAAIGTPAWTDARDRMLGLLPGEDPLVGERIEAWAAEAARLEGEDLTRYLTGSLPEWLQRIDSAISREPGLAEEARRFADSVRALLPEPDGGTPQIATATGHGTVNAVQNGNLYYQVVLGLAPRPRKISRGKAAGFTLAAGAASAGGGLYAADRLTTGAVDRAGTGQLPQAPLADPVQASTTAAQTAGAAPGATAGAKGASVFAKAAAALTKTVTIGGAGAAGVGVPAVLIVGTVLVVVITTVTVFVPLVLDRASCGTAAEGRSAAAVLAEAARRVELTSFRYDVTRGRHHVTGAADPQARTAWFRQGLTDGAVTDGTIDGGEVALAAGARTPPGADPRWVRADGAFVDAIDPAAPARELRSVAGARRDGCAFSGTLAPVARPAAARSDTGSAAPAAARTDTRSVAPTTARSDAGPVAPAAATSAPPSAVTGLAFTARIDEQGRLVRLSIEASAGRLPVTARYWEFGLRVTPSAPQSGGASTPAERASLTGDWAGNWSTGFGSGTFTATLTQDGERLTGDLTVDGVPCSLDGSLDGTLAGDRITFGSVNSERKISFTGDVEGDTMRGTFETDCHGTSGSWTAQRSGT